MKEYIEREQAIALFYPVDPENDGMDALLFTSLVTLVLLRSRPCCQTSPPPTLRR